MYQHNQNTPNFRSENARNFQNISPGNQINNRPFQNSMFPQTNNHNMYGTLQFSGNQRPLNQLPPARLNLQPSLYSDNMFNRTTAFGVDRLNNNTTSSIAGAIENTSFGRGTNFHRFENIPQHNALTQFVSPAVLIPQNNKNFNAQCIVEVDNKRSVAGGSTPGKLKTGSVAPNADTVKTVVRDPIKKNENEKIRIFTGTPEKIIKWHKTYKDYFCFYELIASIISIQEGTVRLQKILLLRANKGPIIQVIHYVSDHIDIRNFCVGQMLRCVGHMVGPNVLHGLSIREATPDEVTIIRRMCYISDHAISKALTKS